MKKAIDSMDLKSAESHCENHEMQIFQIKNDKNAVSNLSEPSDCLPVISVVFYNGLRQMHWMAFKKFMLI